MNAQHTPIVMLKTSGCAIKPFVGSASIDAMKKAGCDTCSVMGCSPMPKSTPDGFHRRFAMATLQVEELQNAVEDVLIGSFYSEVCNAYGYEKESQEAKAKAVDAIVALGMSKDFATQKVQDAFEAIHAQQRQADHESRA